MNLGLFALAVLIFCVTNGAYMLAVYKCGDTGWDWLCIGFPILFSFGFTVMATYLLYVGGYV